jgi:hypothetical protein
MPTIVQLSPTTWLNMDTVAWLRQVDGTSWQVWLSGAPEPLHLTVDEQHVLAHWLMSHGRRGAYKQTRPKES